MRIQFIIAMALELTNLTKEFNDIVAVDNVSLEADDDDFLVLVGPSGSGKTTTLRMIAGLESPTSGDVRIDGETVTEQSPGDRNIAMVFQNYALYPHMTVEENLGLALKVDGIDASELETRVESVATTLGIDDLLDRKPSELSGGQQQRVALGRAIVRDPSVFLMDEPLSNLDAKLRMEMRKEIEELHQRLGTTFVYVTHDQTEAMTMGTKIAILDGGHVQQVGTPEELYDHPVNEFVASFIGSPSMNMIPVDVRNDGSDVWLDGVDLDYNVDGEIARILRDSTAAAHKIGIRPEDIELRGDGAYTADVTVTEPVGSDIIAYLAFGDMELVVETERDGTVQESDSVQFDLPASKVHLFGDGRALN